jgi:hypothetical protein
MARRVCAISGLIVGLALLALLPQGASARTPDEFLSLDLAHALLSPEPLGPPAHFAPFGVQASTQPDTAAGHGWARTLAKTWSAPTAKTAIAEATPAPTAAPAAPAARAVRHHFAQRHRNPLDASAAMQKPKPPKIQRWPCKSGGICGWQTQAAPPAQR